MKSIRKRMLVISCFVILAQMSLMPFIAVKGISPDLIFLLIAFYAFAIDHRDIVWIAFSIGLCRDFLSHTFFGLETASLVCSSLLLKYAVAQFNRKDYFIILLSIYLFSATALLLPVLMMVADQGAWKMSSIFSNISLTSLYTTILAVGIFPVFKRFFGLGGAIRQYELF